MDGALSIRIQRTFQLVSTAASCACSGNRLFSFGMVVSFLCYISDTMIGEDTAIVLRLIKN